MKIKDSNDRVRVVIEDVERREVIWEKEIDI